MALAHENVIPFLSLVIFFTSKVDTQNFGKPGTCPDTTGIITPCLITPDSCSEDVQCSGNKKCCPYGCGKICMNPMESTSPTIPRCLQAPLLPGTINMCRGSFRKYTFNYESGLCELYIYGGCSGSSNLFDTIEQCQRACPVKKHGQCPKPRLPTEGFYMCARTCKYDFECSGRQKCCRNNCGGTSCRSPSVRPPKRGRCPGLRYPDIIHPECYSDYDCSGTRKCCRTLGGGRTCRRPLLYKPGTCPNIKIACFAPMCKDDFECDGDAKCCASNCVCAKPVFYDY